MATKKEIDKHLKLALQEIGTIKPRYNKEFKGWVFSSPLYPVEYFGDSKEEVIENFPFYLRDFLEERLNNNLSPLTEKKTSGRGGKRKGSGRPKGSVKEPSKRVTLPLDIANLLSDPKIVSHLRMFMQAYHQSCSQQEIRLR